MRAERASAAPAETTYEIAFTSVGPIDADVFIADADGTQARPWLPHPGFDGNASFSSDGRWVVFTSEREGSYDIYRAHPDGSGLERLVDHPSYDDQATLSPDGRSLAFVSTRTGQADIWILDLTTEVARNLTSHPAGDIRPAWSPDGQWLAFTTDRDSRKPIIGGFVMQQVTELYVVRADGTGLRRVTQAQTFAGSPTWSADGRQLLFYQAELGELAKIVSVTRLRGTTQIAIVDLATSDHRVLTTGPGEKWSPQFVAADRVGYVSGGPEGGLEFTGGRPGARGEVRAPAWSPERRRMVFHREVDPRWPPFQRWHSMDPRFRLVRTGIFPAYAPSGDRILANDQSGAKLSRHILAMNRDGSQQSVFFAGTGEKSALAPAWSHAGDRVAFVFGSVFPAQLGPAVADIAVVNRDGSGLKILTDGTGNVAFPSWSPDGREIVYRASNKAKQGLFVIAVATGAVRPLTAESSHDNFPAWSPKGDRIAFTRFTESDYELYTVKPDGTDARRMTSAPGNDAHCAWSPDGDWLAFSSSRGGFKDESALHPGNPQPYGDI
jgi:Tol biopolymer transport system component